MNILFYKTGIAILIPAVFLLAGCSTTRITGVWKKSDYVGGPFRNILVIGLTKDESNKSIWEDIMAEQLRQNGVNATTSAKCFPGDTDITKAEILDYVKQQGIDAVLITRLVDIKKKTAYYPPTGGYYHGYYDHYYYGWPYHRYYNHFGSFYDMVYTPGYTTTYTTVVLETNLYDSGTQELVWSMSSDTFDPASAKKLALSVSKKVVKTLQDDNLIRKAR
jgi:hypothetical protein